MSETLSAEEVADRFLRTALQRVDYWVEQEGMTLHQKLENLAADILGMLDGQVLGLPAFFVFPNPTHERHALELQKFEPFWPPHYNIPLSGEITALLAERLLPVKRQLAEEAADASRPFETVIDRGDPEIVTTSA